MLFTTPAIAALRHHYPDARLTYLVEPASEPLVRHNPHLDEVIVVARPRGLARLAYDWRLARRLRASRFDVVIDFHGGPRSAWLTRFTGAPRRIGYDLPGRRWVYTERLPWTRSLLPPRHSVLNQWDLLQPLAIGAADPKTHPVEMIADPAAARRVAERLGAAGVPPQASLIVLHVSASNPFRRWPRASFAEVAGTLAAEDPRRRIIISSGPSEAEAAEEVARQAERRAGAHASSIVQCGEFDLSELRALVGRAALFIGGDTGPLHLASATDTPIVALFGPTLPDRSMPWRDPATPSVAVDAGPLPCRPCHQRHCVPGDFRCLTRITPEAVLKAARIALTARRENGPEPRAESR